MEQWQGSGLTAQEFASQLGVNANTLANWRYKLKRERRAAEEAKTGGGGEPVAFVEITDQLGVAASKEDRLEVVLAGGRVVRVPPAFDAATLRRLVDVLEGR